MIQILDFVKLVGNIKLADAKVVVDATLGNGHDTLWLAQEAYDAAIYGFDIQNQALENTKKRLIEAHVNMDRVQLIQDTHTKIDTYLQQPIDLVLFNFGYLPGGDKTIVTQTETSLVAINKALRQLAPQGIAILVMYPGHDEGQREYEAVNSFVQGLSWNEYRVYCYQIMNNTKKPPIAFIIQKSNLQ